MAAKDQPGKSTKMVWRTCLKCSTRLSELCYDTHTLCETCRNKVCDLNSFCEECESWTPEFRKLYLRNKCTLFQEYEETCLFTKHESLQGDSPRVHPNILKCSLHSLVTKGIRLVGFATRAMVRESPTHCLILNSLAFARGRVILRSHFLILLLLIILISHHIHS